MPELTLRVYWKCYSCEHEWTELHRLVNVTPRMKTTCPECRATAGIWAVTKELTNDEGAKR